MRYPIVAVIALLVILAGCGGSPRQSLEQSEHDYSRPAYQSPNYHPHSSPSFVHTLADTIYIGGDIEPREKLRRVLTDDNGITYYMGASRDGVGVSRLQNYATDLETEDGTTRFSTNGFYPFRVQPKLWFEPGFLDLLDENDAAAWSAFQILADSISILNDALPPEFHIVVANPDNGDRVNGEGALEFRYIPSSSINRECGEDAVACSKASVSRVLGYTNNSDIRIADNIHTLTYSEALTITIHELLHALGIQGHVDSIEFPDSIMGKYGDFFPNPGFTIHRIDREVLQIMYMSQRTTDYNDWSEWTDTSLHLVGRDEDEIVNFGVALFNGLPQPWARGTMPSTPLARNFLLRGNVTWEGSFLGFSGISPVVGDTKLEVNMADLEKEHDLSFSDLTFFNKYESTSDDKWFPTRNIDYKVTMTPNGFYFSGKDEHVVGAFLGKRHEGMAGTLKRTDLVGAFGGKR